MAAIRVEDFLQDAPPKSLSVEKPIDVSIDVGNLLAFDVNQMDLKKFRMDKEQFLLNLTQSNVQLLMQSLEQLPVEQRDRISVVKLPEPSTVLPREKAVPKPKEPTKWEKFAQLKGIQSRKKGRMAWDEETKQYRPRWGYNRKDPSKSWALEVPENADPMEDQFEKVKKQKKESVAKNELQRLRNIARGTKSKVPGVGLTPTEKPSKGQLETALAVTHRSTASVGQFQERLPKEKKKGIKRKFLVTEDGEKEAQKKILKRITESSSVVDANRAANALQAKEERERAASKKEGEEKRKAGRKGKGGKGLKGAKGKKGGMGGKGGKGSKAGTGKKSGGKKRH